MRVVAVDGSGAIRGTRKAIWLAEVNADGVLRLECGRGRNEIVGELVETALRSTQLIVGLDVELDTAAANVDAFDALVSALVMWRHRGELMELSRDPEYDLEGQIWAREVV